MLEEKVAERTAELSRINQALQERVAERDAADERIRESEALLQAFMDNSPNIMFIKDTGGKYLKVNKQVIRSLGMDERMILSQTDADMFPERAAQIKEHDGRVVSTGLPMENEIMPIAVDGVRTRIEHKFPIFDSKGKVSAIGGISVDITDRKRMEQELRISREQLRALASRLHAVREDERVSIARDVHDELGQALTAAKIDVSLLEQEIRSRSGEISAGHILEELGSVKRSIDRAIESVHRIATELRPAVLDDLGLEAAVDWLAQDFQKRTRIQCKLILRGPVSQIDRERSVALFRILQEALSNVLQHAEAKRIEIELGEDYGCYVLRIRDDGIGIRDSKTSDSRSLGLIGMRERALAFRGHVAFGRRQPGGTIVTVVIPRGAESPAPVRRAPGP